MDSPFPSWKKREQISPANDLNPDSERSRAEMYQKLREKYANEIGETDRAVADDQQAVGIFSGLDQMLGAGARARSGSTFEGNSYERMKDNIGKRSDVARADARSGMDDSLRQNEMQWQDKARARQESDWAAQDSGKDPASEESKRAQDLAKRLLPGQDFSGMSAAQIDKSLPMLKEIARKNAPAAAPKALSKDWVDQDGNTRSGKVINGQFIKTPNDPIVKPAGQSKTGGDLEVPGLGVAQTRDDAKNMKSATEMKEKFDRQLGEMIELRKRKGAEVLDRESVARGKQLSKDLLLTYKNLAKLGVLSKSDEDIINAIIPADPLEWNASSMWGEDPTMTQLESLRGDVDQDYRTSIRTRMRDGQSIADSLGGPKQAPPSSSGKAMASEPTEKDAQAVAWARENPNDPRAKEILEMWGQ